MKYIKLFQGSVFRGIVFRGFAILALLTACASNTPKQPMAALPKYDNETKLASVWRTRPHQGSGKEYLNLTPASDESKIFTVDHKGTLAALNINNGKTAWKSILKTPVTSGVAVSKEQLAVGTRNAEIIVINKANGVVQWRKNLSSQILATPLITHNLVLAHTFDGKLFALNASNGDLIWVHERDAPTLMLHGSSAPVTDGETVYLGEGKGMVRALELDSGILKWEQQIVIPTGRNELARMVDIVADPVLYNNKVYLVSYQGQLAALDNETGGLIWQRNMSSYSGLDVKEGILVATDATGNIWAIEPDTGATLWRQAQLANRQLTAPVIVEDKIVVADGEGYLHILSKSDGKLIGREHSLKNAILNQPKVFGNRIYIAGSQGNVIAYALS